MMASFKMLIRIFLLCVQEWLKMSMYLNYNGTKVFYAKIWYTVRGISKTAPTGFKCINFKSGVAR